MMMKFGLDRWLHFAICMVIVMVGGYFGRADIGFAVAFVAGFGKETYDNYKGGKFDFTDLAFSLLGTGAGLLVYYLATLLA